MKTDHQFEIDFCRSILKQDPDDLVTHARTYLEAFHRWTDKENPLDPLMFKALIAVESACVSGAGVSGGACVVLLLRAALDFFFFAVAGWSVSS